MKTKIYFIASLVLFFGIGLNAQTNLVDSLKKNLDTATTFKSRLKILNQLGQNDSINSSSYYEQALKEAPNDSLYFEELIDIASIYIEFSDLKKSNEYVERCIKEAKEKGDLFFLAKAYYQFAVGYTKFAEFGEAINYYDSAIIFAVQGKGRNDSTLLAMIYNGAGSVNYRKGNYEKALVNYQKALEIAEELNLTDGLPTLYANIGLIHEKQENYEIALEYLHKSYNVSIMFGKVAAIIGSSINLSNLFVKMSDYDSAKIYIYIALDSSIQIKNKYLIMHCRNSLGDIYKATDSLQEAIKEYNQVIELAKMMHINDVAASAYLDLSEVNLKLGDSLNSIAYTNSALNSALFALDIALDIQTLPIENRAYEILYKIYKAKNDYKNAFIYAQKYIETNKTLFNQEKTKAIEEMQAKYNDEKQKQEILSQQLEIEKKDAVVKRQKITQFTLLGGSLMLILILIMIYTNLRRKKRDNETIQKQNAALQQANEEIIVQRDVLQEQKAKIEHIHQQLTDSITYAERIQLAAMPTKESLTELFGESFFMIFKPLHIVSGDYYWAKKIGDTIIFSVADCTGHGVPGAFVSMLGISLLNEITQNRNINQPSKVLEFMRSKIKESLKQSGSWEDSKDGMDMVLCSYYPNQNVLEFAGANNPLIRITKDGEMEKFKPVRNPVGIYYVEKKFETITIEIKEGDSFYLFSDGITDQFGGPNESKFTMKRLKDLLLENYKKTPAEQKEIISKVIEEWKGDRRQTDDITLMGLQF